MAVQFNWNKSGMKVIQDAFNQNEAPKFHLSFEIVSIQSTYVMVDITLKDSKGNVVADVYRTNASVGSSIDLSEVFIKLKLGF